MSNSEYVNYVELLFKSHENEADLLVFPKWIEILQYTYSSC